MKNIYFIIVLLLSLPMFAQTEGMSYQAVILNPNTQELPGVNASGNILPNKAITIRFTITNQSGTTIFQEIQSTTTDSYGMVNLFIGEGNQISNGSFIDIEWDGTPKDLKVDIDFEGGNNFTSLSAQKLTFIPYAFYKNITASGDLTVEGTTNLFDGLTVEGETVLANLVVKGGDDIGGGAGANHIALFENTNPSNGNEADGIAIRIQGNESNKLGFRNRFITFYGNDDYVAGRIESYDLLAGDFYESFPVPNFANLINVFDFTQVLEWTPPTLAFSPGTLPSLSGGSLPSLHFHDDGPEFHRGSFPRLNSGTLPSGSLDIGELNLNFDDFFNPQAGANAQNDITGMVAWGMRNGNPGFLPTSPWKIALTPLILAANQIARDQGVIYGSKGADYAEWLEKENPEDEFMFGEVVGVKGGKISRVTKGADQVMSISLAPIVLGNMPAENRKKDFEKVGFMGQVPVLVLGDVKVGDYIVASGYNDGYAKAISSSEIQLKDLKAIIGKAWTGSNGKKANIINVSVGLKTNEWVDILKQQELRLNKLESKLNELKMLSGKLEKIESKLEKLEIN